ncbi:MAG: preprotein translocase subunit SecY, partial [Candidatus Diapherotrites archaeon]|nr:preprotein translocase subunit SecY [Candidatus Diapherotrites archaeon]
MGLIDKLEPFYTILPSVKGPDTVPNLRTKVMWTAVALLIFFFLGEIPLLGLSSAAAGQFSQFQMILASNIGTVLTAGIGPIVIASLVLMLLSGAKIIPLDTSTPDGRVKYMGVQKLLAVFMCIVEPFAYALGGFLEPSQGFLIFGLINTNLLLIVTQVALGSLILLYLDEITTKYGLGSGISLFIAAGVSLQIFWRLFDPFSGTGLFWFLGGGPPQGLIFATFY